MANTVVACCINYCKFHEILIVPHIFQAGIVQDGAEPTDIFQMVIDNIWKEGKISETIYKYVPVCYLLPTDYKLIF